MRKNGYAMSTYSIQDIVESTDRYKLYALLWSQHKLSACIRWVQQQEITTVNIGRELSNFIDSLDDFRYLTLDVFYFLKGLLDKHKRKVNDLGHDVLAIYNLGILFEPSLDLNAAQILKDFSKNTGLIIIWENHAEPTGQFYWPTQQQHVFIDFTDVPLKKITYAL